MKNLLFYIPILVAVAISGCGGGGGVSGSSATLQIRDMTGEPTNVDWVAFQDGDGPWQKIEPSSTGVYVGKVEDSNGRYGFAYVSDIGFSGRARVMLATLGETHEWHETIHSGVVLDARLTVSTESLADGLDISIGLLDDYFSPYWAEGKYIYYELPSGKYDLIATTGTSESSKMVLLRDLAIDGSNQVDLDFDGLNAFTPDTYTVTINGATNVWCGVKWQTASYQEPFTIGQNYDSRASTFQYKALPAEKLAADDLYVLSADSYTGTSGITKYVFFTSASDKTIDMNASPFDSPTLTPNESDKGYTASWEPYPGAISYAISYGASWATITAGRANNGKTTFTWPDFSSVSGWDSMWNRFVQNINEWSVGAAICNSPVYSYTDAQRDGVEVTCVSKNSGNMYRGFDKKSPGKRSFLMP